MDANMMTLLEAVMVHGNMDAKTAFRVQQCDKAVCDLVGMYKDMVLREDDTVPAVWVSNILSLPISTTGLQEITRKLRLIDGESESMMNTVMDTDEVFHDLALQDKFVAAFFSPAAHADDARVRKLFMSFCSLFVIRFNTMREDNTPKDKLVIAFALVGKVVCELVTWIIRSGSVSTRNLRNLISTLRQRQTYFISALDDYTDPVTKPTIEHVFMKTKKYITAWHRHLFTTDRVFIGPKGGVYTINTHGTKRYL